MNSIRATLPNTRYIYQDIQKHAILRIYSHTDVLHRPFPTKQGSACEKNPAAQITSIALHITLKNTSKTAETAHGNQSLSTVLCADYITTVEGGKANNTGTIICLHTYICVNLFNNMNQTLHGWST